MERDDGTGAGSRTGAGTTGGDDTREKQGSSASDEAKGRDGKELAERAHIASLNRKQAGNRPASGHTHRREARAQKNIFLETAMSIRLVAKASCKPGLSTPRGVLACAWEFARRI